MQLNSNDKIEKRGMNIYHESAGGFVFYEDPKTHKLFVALIKQNGGSGLFIPKGHLKNGEKPQEASVREINEELTLNHKLLYISNLGVDQYSFTLNDDGCVHYKKVYLYVYELKEKEDIRPPENENINEAIWVEFYDALENITYDKNNLLKARQLFYRYRTP